MKAKVGVVFLIILAGLAGYFFYISVESYEETIDQGWSNKAKRNPYLALHQYLELHGSSVTSSSRLKQLDSIPSGGVVFIADTRQLKKQARIDNLIQWMENGGTLVVGAHVESKDNKSILLDRYSVTKEFIDCECDKDAKPPGDEVPKKMSDILREANEELKKQAKKNQSNKDGVAGGKDGEGEADDVKKADKKDPLTIDIPEEELTKLHFDKIDQPVSIHFSRSSALQHPTLVQQQTENYEGPKPVYWEGNQSGSQILQFYVGDGLLTVLSDSSIWESDNIGKVDHAYLSNIMFGNNSNVVLLYGMQLPSLWELLKHFAPEFLIACTALFFVWLLYKVKRFGPIRELDVTTRRSLDEHIAAMNGYLWRSNKHQKILDNMHKIIFQRANNANPGFSALDEKEQVHWIGEHCILPEKDVQMALYAKEVLSEEHFYQMTKLIQKIGNRL